MGAAPLLGVPASLVQGARQEAELWKEEFAYYGRKWSRDTKDAMGIVPEPVAPPPGPDLDPRLAETLLTIPLEAMAALPLPTPAGVWDEPLFVWDRDRYLAQELPYARKAKLCGRCEGTGTEAALADRDNVDFLSYAQFKAIARQLLPAAGEGEGLDEIRVATRTLLEVFAARGYVEGSGVSFFGASKNEERNHIVWERGEPAYVKIWLYNPAFLRSSRGLAAEERGLSQDFLASAVEALLRRRGVEARSFQQYASQSAPAASPAIANQWTVVRTRPTELEAAADEANPPKRQPFSLDSTPFEEPPTYDPPPPESPDASYGAMSACY